MTHLPYFVAAWLFLVGLYGVVTSRNLVHLIICLTVVQSSTYVLLLGIGYRVGRGRPGLRRYPDRDARRRPDRAGADAH